MRKKKEEEEEEEEEEELHGVNDVLLHQDKRIHCTRRETEWSMIAEVPFKNNNRKQAFTRQSTTFH